MDALKNYDRILDYESGNLDTNEASKFKEELSQDGLLATEYRSYQASKEVADYLTYQETKYLIQDISKEEKKGSRLSSLNRWAIAASVALVISLGLTYTWLGQNYSNEQLIQQNYYALNLSDVRKGGNPANVLQAPFDAYVSGNYQEAIDILENTNDERIEIDLLKGHLFLKLGQPDKAITSLTKVIQENDQRFKENAQWHIGLAYLAKDDLKNARIVYESFLESETPVFQRKSSALLQRMNSSLWKLAN